MFECAHLAGGPFSSAAAESSNDFIFPVAARPTDTQQSQFGVVLRERSPSMSPWDHVADHSVNSGAAEAGNDPFRVAVRTVFRWRAERRDVT